MAESEQESNNDLHNVCRYAIDKTNIKHLFFIFIVYLITNSSFFEESFLMITSEYKNNNTTLQSIKKTLVFTIIFVIIDQLIQYKII